MSSSRVILVTGGNAGIGYELVRLLAEQGHTVYLGARNPDLGKEAQAKLVSEGLSTVKFVHLDVTKPATIQAAVQAVSSSEDGRLDTLVNNAATAKFEDVQNALKVDLDTIRDAMEVNLFGLIETTKAFLPLLRKSTSGVPTIINVSTASGSNTIMSNPNMKLHWVAYNMSKAAVNSYTIALAYELGKEELNFKVNAVTPGFSLTGLNNYGKGSKAMEEFMKHVTMEGKAPRAGAQVILPWVVPGKDGKSGVFAGDNEKELPW